MAGVGIEDLIRNSKLSLDTPFKSFTVSKELNGPTRMLWIAELMGYRVLGDLCKNRTKDSVGYGGEWGLDELGQVYSWTSFWDGEDIRTIHLLDLDILPYLRALQPNHAREIVEATFWVRPDRPELNKIHKERRDTLYRMIG